MFEHFRAAPGDPILSLVPLFERDPRPGKVNLGIGLYLDDCGQLPVLRSVRAAAEILHGEARPYPYLPMAGDTAYRQAVQALLFGADHARVLSGCVSTVQTVGGTGALKLGAEVLKRHFPDSGVWVSEPGWDNHRAIFEGSGFAVHPYPYGNPASQVLDFDGLLSCLGALPPKSIVLLHACCHNPTGVDPTPEQWTRILDVAHARALIPFFDLAYQGFGAGVGADCHALRLAADAGLSFLVANSFSKNFALYGERCGALSIVCQNREEAGRALGQMETAVRRMYSSPPRHGGQIVAGILRDDDLRGAWCAEVDEMRGRLGAMRRSLADALHHRRPDRDFSHLVRQRGMFTQTGLSAEAVAALREEHAIYLAPSGRLCVSGLNEKNVADVAEAMAQHLPEK